MEIIISGDNIELKNYPYSNFFNKKRVIYSHEINFIKTDSSILYVCIKSSEILFIPAIYKDKIETFINQNGIKVSVKPDVWELICFPFVDQHRTETDLAKNAQELKALAFEPDEVAQIRNKVRRMITWRVVFTMEYGSILHPDLLEARKKIFFLNPFYSNFYWYTMRIALKGYGI
jgi:hypothetical protein